MQVPPTATWQGIPGQPTGLPGTPQIAAQSAALQQAAAGPGIMFPIQQYQAQWEQLNDTQSQQTLDEICEFEIGSTNNYVQRWT